MRVILPFVVVGLLLAQEATASGRRLEMYTQPSVAADLSHASIKFRFIYRGSKPIKVNIDNLIGKRAVENLQLQAFTFPDYRKISPENCPAPAKNIGIDDPGVGSEEIKPGSELTQEVDLLEAYGNLKQIIGKCDLVIYWSYKLDVVNGADVRRMAGAVVIPADLRDQKTQVDVVDF